MIFFFKAALAIALTMKPVVRYCISKVITAYDLSSITFYNLHVLYMYIIRDIILSSLDTVRYTTTFSLDGNLLEISKQQDSFVSVKIQTASQTVVPSASVSRPINT